MATPNVPYHPQSSQVPGFNPPPRRRRVGAALDPKSMFFSIERLSDFEFGWLVAILEAEGCFSGHNPYNSAVISISMIDEDTIKRVASFLDTKVYPYTLKSGTTAYRTQLGSDRGAVWMSFLKPYMSMRRQAQIDKCLQKLRLRVPMLEAMKRAREAKLARRNATATAAAEVRS